MAMRHRQPDVPDRDDVDWDALFQDHGPRLRRRVAKRVPDPAIVDDVIQETFIQAYRRWPTYDRTRPLWPWLVGIAFNRAWWWSKATQKVAAVESEDADLLVEEPLLDYLDAGSDDHVANLHRRAAMRRALDGMTEKHRRILLAWELGDRSVSDLAAAEGMTTEELRATVVRARRSLRRRYFDAAGDGPFGWVVVGLGGVVARWRERFARVATTSGWTEAATSLATAPVVAVAGMAMITLVPAPPSQAPPAGTLAEEPAAYVHDAPSPTPAVGTAPAAVSTPSATAVAASAPPPVAAAPAATTSTLSAGPTAAAMTTSSNSQQMQFGVDGPNGGVESDQGNEVNCGYNVATTAFCELSATLPPQG